MSRKKIETGSGEDPKGKERVKESPTYACEVYPYAEASDSACSDAEALCTASMLISG